jgi:hypothetical protein
MRDPQMAVAIAPRSSPRAALTMIGVPASTPR